MSPSKSQPATPSNPQILHYVAGTILFILYVGFNFILQDLSMQAPQSLFARFFSSAFFPIQFVVVLAIYLILRKKSPHLAYGFLAGLFTLILFFVDIIVELTIHPPDEP